MRRLCLLLPIVLAALLGLCAPPAGAADGVRNPVLFVHGYSGGGWNFAYLAAQFRQAGYPEAYLTQWYYDWNQDNVVTATQVAAKVDAIKRATGRSKVDIVTHSMGGLSTRYYLKNLGGTANVGDWVSIGGPNHGTNAAYACFSRSCVDMRYGSAFLTQLNSGDETPGNTQYTTFWSPCDEVINPDGSTPLAGAQNIHTSCLGHLGLLASYVVAQGVLDAVR